MSPAKRWWFNEQRETTGWATYAARNPARAAFYQSPGWKTARAQQLVREPNCQAPGCDQKAAVVDHIVARSEGGPELDPNNLQSLCRSHHRRKTGLEGARGQKRAAQIRDIQRKKRT